MRIWTEMDMEIRIFPQLFVLLCLDGSATMMIATMEIQRHGQDKLVFIPLIEEMAPMITIAMALNRSNTPAKEDVGG